jgi:transcriptional regulator with XRE-family HTH domain
VSPLEFLLREMRRRRVAAGLTQAALGELIHFSDSHVSGVETGTRPVRPDYLRAVDEALDTGGLLLNLWEELVKHGFSPIWLREWIEFERAAASLHWYEPAYVPGLFQTEAYARATLAGGRFTPTEIEQAIAARLARQEVLSRADPPQFVAVIDEAVIRRQVRGRPDVMREQLEQLAERAGQPHVHLHVVPAETGIHLGLTGAFIIAEASDGHRVAHADSQLEAQITDEPADVGRLAKTWESIRSEALPHHQSLTLIEEVVKAWT